MFLNFYSKAIVRFRPNVVIDAAAAQCYQDTERKESANRKAPQGLIHINNLGFPYAYFMSG
jgi:hypothetical protein